MRYLTAGDVIEINRRELDLDDAIVDFGLLESAVLRPQQTVGGMDAYPNLHTKAAALFHSLVRNHPFVDGNKRTGVIAMGVFYGLNGYWIDTAPDALVALAIDVAEGQLDVDAIAGRLKTWATAIELDEEFDL
jgi:death-on-curing protein